jgi:heavy metal sensor kinase
MSEMHQRLAAFTSQLIVVEGIVLVLGLAGGWWLASRAIAPIKNISAAAVHLASGRLDERIAILETDSELGQLANILNDTFAKLDAAFAEQARFTSDAAHELRTPIAVILAQTQLALSRTRTVEEYRETLETVRRSGQRMHGLVESLLTLACFDNRSETLERKALDLADLAREHLDLMRPLAEERQIVLESDLAPARCSADPGRLAQIVVNLLSNAVKYTRPGDHVKVATASLNGHVLVSVADTGPGIAAEHLPHLFERFFRADASRNRSTGGAGLGLAICKTLAEAHNGAIEVTSAVGQGSVFTLRLPAA